jgi:hypothetical protein
MVAHRFGAWGDKKRVGLVRIASKEILGFGLETFESVDLGINLECN